MRDHHKFVAEDGRIIPVSEMSDADIAECLIDGIAGDGPVAEEIRTLERLRIEQTIRRLGLR
jgi:hypothetical protein